MEGLPPWILWATAVVFAVLGVWSVTAENSAGIVAGFLFAAMFVVLAVRRSRV
ncbi:MAG TPA: hypothetical protein VEC09_03300 [Actinomycetota bacterium]|jgi:hypothetical protein|nr:hypothetical protein [Actinomycetota bacterium]